MRPMRWVGDVDRSEFEHACQSALSLNYPYDNDCVGNTNMIRVINIMKPVCLKCNGHQNKLNNTKKIFCKKVCS